MVQNPSGGSLCCPRAGQCNLRKKKDLLVVNVTDNKSECWKVARCAPEGDSCPLPGFPVSNGTGWSQVRSLYDRGCLLLRACASWSELTAEGRSLAQTPDSTGVNGGCVFYSLTSYLNS